MTTAAQYDVHPDGGRLLMLRQPGADDAQAQLRVVDGWFSVLRERAGE